MLSMGSHVPLSTRRMRRRTSTCGWSMPGRRRKRGLQSVTFLGSRAKRCGRSMEKVRSSHPQAHDEATSPRRGKAT